MKDSLLRTNMKAIFTPGVEYQLPEGLQPFCKDPRKAEILASMPACNALGLVGRTNLRPQPAVVETRKAKAPSSSDEDGEILESDDFSCFTGSSKYHNFFTEKLPTNPLHAKKLAKIPETFKFT